MKYSNKKGFTLIELLVVLAVISVIGVYANSVIRGMQLKKLASKQSSEISDVENAIQIYTLDNGAKPSSLDDLISGVWWKLQLVCKKNSAGNRLCIDVKKSSWGGDYTLINSKNFLTLKVDISNIKGLNRQYFIEDIRNQYPVSSVQNDDLYVQFNIKDRQGWNSYVMPTDVDTSKFLKQDGSTPLTNDWDIGDNKITNVKDIYLKGKAKNDQAISVAAGLIRSQGYVKDGDFVSKPDCSGNPDYSQPNIVAWLVSIVPDKNHPEWAFESISSFEAKGTTIPGHDSEWKLSGKFTAYNVNDRIYEVYNNHVLATDPSAHTVLGYMTFCSKEPRFA